MSRLNGNVRKKNALPGNFFTNILLIFQKTN